MKRILSGILMVASLNVMAACDAPEATTCSITSSSITSNVKNNFVDPLHQALTKLDSHQHIISNKIKNTQKHPKTPLEVE